MPNIVLHHFLFSHFNEKARWALAYKGVAHRRVGEIPGPHARRMYRLTGQRLTPALAIDGAFVCGSAALIDRLETLYPEPALYPAEPAARDRALAWQARVDNELGHATRSIVWGVLIENPRYTAAMFGRDLNPVLRFGYAQLLRLRRELIVKVNRVTADDIARARVTAAGLMDEIAAAVADTGYLVGTGFSVADLAAACLLSPFLRLGHDDMRRPEPMPAALVALIEEYAAHPACVWALDMFERHRPEN